MLSYIEKAATYVTAEGLLLGEALCQAVLRKNLQFFAVFFVLSYRREVMPRLHNASLRGPDRAPFEYEQKGGKMKRR